MTQPGQHRNDPPISIWHFDGAPDKYRVQSGHGGDEDWIIYSPPGLDPNAAEVIVEKIAICDFTHHPQEDGSVVWITAHA